MRDAVKFIVIGYLSGSILFARICAKLLDKPCILNESKDGNPGTVNAFKYGGFLCGQITLIGDLAKGFMPVFAYSKCGGGFTGISIVTALVLAAPVVGHIFPVFFRFQGGKGIAVTFGCLLGAYPELTPLLVFALLFVLFSVVFRITPHFARTIVTYTATLLIIIFLHCTQGIIAGFGIISATVILRLHMSNEVREKPEVKLLWMR